MFSAGRDLQSGIEANAQNVLLIPQPILHFNGQPFSKHRLDKEQLVKALKDFDNASATRNPKHE